MLVAFTIEFDNEAEHRFVAAGRERQFLISLAMWANYLQFVREPGTRVRELEIMARTSAASLQSRLGAFERWRYVEVAAGLVRPTPYGVRAQSVWRGLTQVIEERWRARFGAAAIAALREVLESLLRDLNVHLPSYLPVVGNAMFAEVRHVREPLPRAERDLSVLISQVLLVFTIEFERASDLSLPISANALRVIDTNGVPSAKIPALTGISKEAARVSIGFLQRNGFVSEKPDPKNARRKLVCLTPSGARAQTVYRKQLAALEERWRSRFGESAIRTLRESLHALLPLLSSGLRPHEGGWRASKPYSAQTEAMIADPSAALPQYPMVLHRGGWPDGS